MTELLNQTNILLNGDDLAEVLNISRTQAYRLMRKGDIKSIRFGRLVRVHPKDLEQFILEHRR